MHCRPATADDALDIAQVQVASWQVAYKGIVPDSYLITYTVEKRHQAWDLIIGRLEKTTSCLYVAEVDNQIIGFSRAGPASLENVEFDAELFALYATPEFYGTGVGMSLFKKCIEFFQHQNHQNFYCWCMADNKIGNNFYKKANGTLMDEKLKHREMSGVSLKEVMYAWKALPDL